MLTTRQRNEIFGMMAARGLDPASFELVDRTLITGKSQADLLHKPTGSGFTVWHPQRLDLYHANVVVGGADQAGCTFSWLG
jgi:hypothetical protein